MKPISYYKPHHHNFECDICKGVFKSDQKKKRWDGAVVCYECWDAKPWFMYRYPKVQDLKPVPNARPDSFTTSTVYGLTWDTAYMLIWGAPYIPIAPYWESQR